MDKLVHGKKHHGVNTGKVTLNGKLVHGKKHHGVNTGNSYFKWTS